MYKFVGVCFAEFYSSVKCLWVDLDTRALYISSDQQDLIPNSAPTQEYMLLNELIHNNQPKLSEFKNKLTDGQRLTRSDYENKCVIFNGVEWKFNI